MFSKLLLVLAMSVAHADEPTFTIVGENEPAPFAGVLLSPPAAAEILTTHDEQQAKCDLEIEFQLDKAGSDCNFHKRLIEIRAEACEEAREADNKAKNLEIDSLKAVIKKQSPQRKWMWMGIGAVAGGAAVIGIQQAVTQ
jgi:hypothetical protein